MAKEFGRNYPLSPFRRLVTDLMRISRSVPAVTIERRINLAAVAAARRRCIPRPSWTVIFAKAFALVARSNPDLRRSYMAFPWPRLYEHPSSTAVVNVARQLPGEAIVVQCLIRRPENRSLARLDDIVRFHQSEPVERLRWYQRALATSRLPWPIRPLFWWGALNLFGRRRCHNFGTFGVTSIAAHGAGVLNLVPLLTSTLHYGLFDQAGFIDMRLALDHRVLDGATAARALVELERTLHGDLLAELTAMATTATAA
jgi:hypothetical protein